MVDISKGDQPNANYRPRLASREVNTHKRDDPFAATLLLEAWEPILSTTAAAARGEIPMAHDMGRAFFHARAKREVYVQLPE